MRQAKDEAEFRRLTAEDRLTVAVFKAGWCKDCHYIEPFMPEVEAAYADRLTLVEVDRDALPDLCAELGILGIPSFVAFRGGRELVRFVSKLRKTREEIERFLDRAVEVSAALAERG